MTRIGRYSIDAVANQVRGNEPARLPEITIHDMMGRALQRVRYPRVTSVTSDCPIGFGKEVRDRVPHRP